MREKQEENSALWKNALVFGFAKWKNVFSQYSENSCQNQMEQIERIHFYSSSSALIRLLLSIRIAFDLFVCGTLRLCSARFLKITDNKMYKKPAELCKTESR